MNHRDNFFAMMHRERPERLPLDMPMTPPVRERLKQRYETDDFRERLGVSFGSCGANYVSDPDEWREAYRRLGIELPEPHTLDAIGRVHRIPDAADMGEATHLAEAWPTLSEIENVADIEGLPFPEPGDPKPYEHIPEAVASIQQRGLVSIGQAATTIFERAWMLRGMDRTFFDLLDEHPVTTWLFDYFTERSCEAMRAFCEAGIDVIHLGDDVASQQGLMMSKDMWRTHLRPRMEKVVGTIREHQTKPIWVSYHSDGDVTDLVEDLIDLGIDILNPVQPECMDFDGIRDRFGDRIGLYGGIGTQTTMPFGTPDDVRATVARLADAARHGCAVIAAPTHVLEPDVPDENIDALVASIRETDLRAAAV